MTPGEARAKRLQSVLHRRVEEKACALDFLRFGDEVGFHAKRCIHKSNPCSRYYDPYADEEVAPDPKLYEGTGIGFLYGFDGSERHAWQSAGWNSRRKRRSA